MAFIGQGPQAEPWRSALGELADVKSPQASLEDCDALALGPGADDPYRRAREALLAGVPVLYAASFQLSPWQAAALNALSRKSRCLLRVAEPFQHRAGFSFVQRLLSGEEPFWRPLYLRTLSLAPPGSHARIDELAMEALAVCDVFLGGGARSVTAAGSRHDELGELCAVFFTVNYADGVVAQGTVSLAEARAARELVVATNGRTLVLDDLDKSGHIRVLGDGEQVLDQPSARPADAVGAEARLFLEAAAQRDWGASNGDRWERVATLWWAIRQALSFGGSSEVSSPVVQLTEAGPPPLTLIRGGGRAPAAGPRPRLTLVG